MALLKINDFCSVTCNNFMLGSIATLYFCHYSSRYFQTDSHQSVSACLAFFEAACHILMCNLAFLVHLGVATLSLSGRQ